MPTAIFAEVHNNNIYTVVLQTKTLVNYANFFLQIFNDYNL